MVAGKSLSPLCEIPRATRSAPQVAAGPNTLAQTRQTFYVGDLLLLCACALAGARLLERARALHRPGSGADNARKFIAHWPSKIAKPRIHPCHY